MQFILLSVVTFLCVEASSPSSVVSLDDSNFEHLVSVPVEVQYNVYHFIHFRYLDASIHRCHHW